MTHVKAGDIVFHYWQQPGQEPAIVSWSQVVGPAFSSSIIWKPRGKNATRLAPRRQVAWQVPLGGMCDVANPVTLSDLRAKSTQIKKVLDSLRSKHGDPTYFPFFWYKGALRAQQLYLTKLPADVVSLFPGLLVQAPGGADPTDDRANSPEPRSRTAGYVSDPVLRKAIELQAMAQADQLLVSLGYSTTDVSSNNPYDIRAVKGDETLAVEVKGSSGTATTVDLTIGEVKVARDPAMGSMLVVVDEIPVDVVDGQVTTRPGRVRYWTDWNPDDPNGRLLPIRFKYLLGP